LPRSKNLAEAAVAPARLARGSHRAPALAVRRRRAVMDPENTTRGQQPARRRNNGDDQVRWLPIRDFHRLNCLLFA